ncbi:hypothetical protein RASY3_02430 [Ruminococcus albus SY3]|uniref:LicD/FKTN/FKRP nucleotidyltransferase domain-containing protein n=1 Tax=Ruminococcus albus SY3 TaxID=1341156 RepID=A0A011UK70_RUMAL|nr:LicD family protein [Ruminococcus albus]EXM40994.1 hypothetical protein RASY3_02430 [Ruminococcus albus SY3]
MNLTYEEMLEVNKVQLEIFKQFIDVCNKLNLKYYMVHGSLLGTLRCNGFFPFDDDIDVAMPRKDYDILLKKGQKLFSNRYFIQSYKSEKNYPLPFAKIRDSKTAFIQPVLKGLNVNQGIYIDIFPLDNYPTSKLTRTYLSIKERIYSIRISEQLLYSNKQPLWKRILRVSSKIACPSWRMAVKKRADLYSNIPNSSLFITVGGKVKERGIDKSLFEKGLEHSFEDVTVNCPSMSQKYLSIIYGDFENYNPAEKYMNEDNTVTVSAEIVSTTQSYKKL